MYIFAMFSGFKANPTDAIDLALKMHRKQIQEPTTNNATQAFTKTLNKCLNWAFNKPNTNS